MNGEAVVAQALDAGEKLGPGLLVLVVGPSGAGKDTLLAYARARLAERTDLRFARRRITRPADATENHIPLDERDFAQGVALGSFPLYWRANGLSYALGAEVAEDILAGCTVVANGSRAAVSEARRRFARVKTVHITAPVEMLAARIAARGRESAQDVLARLKREPALDAPPDLTVLNVGTVETAGAALADFLDGLG